MNKPEIAFKLLVAIREPTGSFGVAFCPLPSCQGLLAHEIYLRLGFQYISHLPWFPLWESGTYFLAVRVQQRSVSIIFSREKHPKVPKEPHTLDRTIYSVSHLSEIIVIIIDTWAEIHDRERLQRTFRKGKL